MGIDWRRRSGDRNYILERFETAGNAAAASFSWTSADGRRGEWAQALILRDGRIVHIQDFASPDSAFKAIRR